MARSAAVDDLLGQAPEVLHEHHTERDRDGPQLADGQHLDALESLDEALEGLGLEAAVGVGDEGPGQPEHARVALEGAVGELRQLAVESRRKILPDLAGGRRPRCGSCRRTTPRPG